MSWDNVTGIKNIKIWTDYADSTQGHLFVNNNHQLQLSVGISFTLKSGTTEGPTKDEVNAALSLINNQDSGPLKYLQLSPKGNFIQVYDPNHVRSTADSNTPEVEEGVYDFVLTYWVYSPISINAEAHTETIALRVAYTDSAGNNIVKETSKTGNYSTKTFVTVCCYQPILYGSSGENRIPVDITYQQVPNSDYKSLNSGNYTREDDSHRHYWMFIDHGYFRIFNFDGAQDPNPDVSIDDDLRPYSTFIESDGVMWDHVYDAYFPNIKCGEMTYDVKIKVMAGPNDSIYDAQITIHQLEGQITFITSTTTAKRLDNGETQKTPFLITLYDQFGNCALAYMDSSGNQVTIHNIC